MRKKNELDVESLNSLVSLTRKILRVVFVVVILSAILVGLALINKLHIGEILLSTIKVAAPFFIGFVIAWLLNPAVTFFQKKNVKRGLGSAFVFVMFLLVIFVIFRVMLPMLYTQINDFVEIIPTLFLQVGNFIHESFSKLNATGFDFTSIEENIYAAIEGLGVNITTSLPSVLINGVGGVVSSVSSILLGLIIGFYLLIDFDSMKKIFNFVPKKHKNTIRKLVKDLDDTCKDFVSGTLLISCVVFIITSVLFSIVGLPSPMLFGLICGITNIIPYIGPWIGGAIAAIVGFTVSPLVGILTIVIAFVSQQIDGLVLQPLIMGKTMKLHPVIIMIGLLVFGYFFGVLGMILATPSIACLKVIAMFINDKYKLKEKIINAE